MIASLFTTRKSEPSRAVDHQYPSSIQICHGGLIVKRLCRVRGTEVVTSILAECRQEPVAAHALAAHSRHLSIPTPDAGMDQTYLQ